jgi:predicted membrane metal-binding protein
MRFSRERRRRRCAMAMGVLVAIAGRLRRDSQVFVSLALTGAVMLGLKPALAQDVSFLLSFAGTFGIAAMTDRIARRLKGCGFRRLECEPPRARAAGAGLRHPGRTRERADGWQKSVQFGLAEAGC